MKQTIEQIKQYLELSENVYLINLVNRLEIQIDIEILKAEINQVIKK